MKDSSLMQCFQPFLHHGPLYAIKKFWGTPNKILGQFLAEHHNGKFRQKNN